MRARPLRFKSGDVPPNEAARLFELDADDLFARRGRLRVDSSLGQESRLGRRRLGRRRPR